MDELEIYTTKSGNKIKISDLQEGGRIKEEKDHLTQRIERLKIKIEGLQNELKRLENIKNLPS